MQGKKEAIDAIKAKGAQIVEGDAANVEELTTAAKGVDTIVSLLGIASLLAGEEKNVLKAAKSVGVKRIVPSQFGVDVSAAP
jgi:uncharacterized protein YbjT (DUF2867 family)